MKEETLKNYVALKADGHKTIYFAECGGLEFLFRPLTFNEYKLVLELEQILTGVHINDAMLRFTVLYSSKPLEEWLNNALAIIPDKLAEAVLKCSGFQDEAQFAALFQEKRQEASQLEALIQIYICSAFKAIRPEEVGAMTLDEQLYLLAMAENAIGNPIDIDGIMKGRQEQGPTIPVPPGMETTAVGPEVDELVSPEVANLPNWEQLAKGKKQW